MKFFYKNDKIVLAQSENLVFLPSVFLRTKNQIKLSEYYEK